MNSILPTPVAPVVSETAPTCLADGFSTITNYDATLNYVSAVLQEKNVPEKFSPVMTGILSRSYFNQDAGCMEIVTNTYVKKEIARKM